MRSDSVKQSHHNIKSWKGLTIYLSNLPERNLSEEKKRTEVQKNMNKFQYLLLVLSFCFVKVHRHEMKLVHSKCFSRAYGNSFCLVLFRGRALIADWWIAKLCSSERGRVKTISALGVPTIGYMTLFLSSCWLLLVSVRRFYSRKMVGGVAVNVVVVVVDAATSVLHGCSKVMECACR